MPRLLVAPFVGHREPVPTIRGRELPMTNECALGVPLSRLTLSCSNVALIVLARARQQLSSSLGVASLLCLNSSAHFRNELIYRGSAFSALGS
jgi:hypothetical protein